MTSVAPKERPILFSAPMVRAVLAGRKTVTRRIVREAEGRRVDVAGDGTPVYVTGAPDDGGEPIRCPYGAPGERLWVRETFERGTRGADTYAANWPRPKEAPVVRWTPSIFMRRHESRITLEVVDVRAERLQEISGDDIVREGAVDRGHDDPNLGRCPVSAFDGKLYPDLVSLWRAGWDSINGARAPWATNPWVWRVEFKRVAVDAMSTESKENGNG